MTLRFGLPLVEVTTASRHQMALLQALVTLPRSDNRARVGAVRRVWSIPARTRAFTGRDDLLPELAPRGRQRGAGGGAGGDRNGWSREDRHGDRYAYRHRDDFDIA